MENKINIAEILRDMPKGTKLYSPLFGKCELEEVINDKEYPITVCLGIKLSFRAFTKDGCYLSKIEGSECVLFPSSKMRCWSKFFKRGDILVYSDLEKVVVFDGWAEGDYTKFKTTINHYKISDGWDKGSICLTSLYTKATDKERAKFIAAAEKHYGGKYNPETLQVEPVKVVESKRSFEPFQKVLVRDDECDTWKADYFSNYEKGDKTYRYNCVGSFYKSCIPYEGNEHLLGTDNRPE